MRRFFFSLFFFFSFWAQADSVHVRSNLWDMGTGQEIEVSGVGSLIYVDQRFFILTAGHVSLGENLQIFGEDLVPFPVVSRWDDPVADLSLIEVQPSKHQIKKHILAIYQKHPHLKGLGLVTDLMGPTIDLNGGDGSFMVQMRLGDVRRHRSVNVETGSLGSTLLDIDEIKIKATQMLVAPWLKAYSESEWARSIDKNTRECIEGAKNSESCIRKYFFDRFADKRDRDRRQSYHLNIPFPQGYSGSPILSHHGSTMMSTSELYTISGVLTLSNSNSAETASRAAAVSPLHRLIGQARSGAKNSNANPFWFLVQGVFAKIDSEVVLYVFEGPVGNGIAPIGQTRGQKKFSDRKSGELNQRLLKLGLDSNNRDKVRSDLMEMSRLRKDSETNSKDNDMKEGLRDQEERSDRSKSIKLN